MVDHKWISIEELSEYLGISAVIRTSAKKNAGIEEFEQLLEQMFFHGEIRSEDEVVITSMRHKEALCEAYDSLKMAADSYRMINAGHKRIGPASFMHS